MAHQLRDPTHEELFVGPSRALPADIQELPAEETACTFCGVSYFVFAEVQALQRLVKSHKTAFRKFVRFLERERQVSQELRVEVLAVRSQYEQLASSLATKAARVGQENSRLWKDAQDAHAQLETTQRELEAQQTQYKEQLQAQCRRQQDEWCVINALTEQKFRNEILHLSSDLEKCRLLSSTKETEAAALLERERTLMRSLEAQWTERQATCTATENLIVTERDMLKQQLLAADERVDMERETARKLEIQLRVVQQELARVVAANESERASFTQSQSDVVLLKHQLQNLEKNKSLLLAERVHLQEQQVENSGLLIQLRSQVTALERKNAENAQSMERVKSEYVRELESLRVSHFNELNRLQKLHAQSMDELRAAQAQYVEFLQKETKEQVETDAGTRQRSVLQAMEAKMTDAVKAASRWKDEAQRSQNEAEMARLRDLQSKTQTEAMARQITYLERKSKDLEQETETLQSALEQMKTQSRAQKQQAELTTTDLVQRMEMLETQLGTTTEQNERLLREQSNKLNSQDCAELAKLRQTVKLKDHEILLLQQTVHRECMERTSLLEKLRSGKILPDETLTPERRSFKSSEATHGDNNDEDAGEIESKPRAASFYEKLRRAGSHRSKPHHHR